MSQNYVQRLAGNIKAEVPAEFVPEGDVGRLFELYALLALVKGPDVSPRDVHNAWSAWMTEQEPRHESIKPFDELEASVRRDDQPFVDAIRRVAVRKDA